MPWKLISFILTLMIIMTFIGVNLDHKSDIRLWFGEKGLLRDIPIFVSFFVMYLIGVLSVIPFLLGWKWQRALKEKIQTTKDGTDTKIGRKEKKEEKKKKTAQDQARSPEDPLAKEEKSTDLVEEENQNLEPIFQKSEKKRSKKENKAPRKKRIKKIKNNQ